jgi:cell division inhibitor SepF
MAGGIFNKLLNMVGLEDVEQEPEELKEEEDYYDLDEEDVSEDSRFSKRRGAKVVGLPSAVKMRMIVYQPKSNEDTQDIIDNLKARKPVVVNLEEMDNDIAQRVLDFVSGAVYALNGNIKKVARGIFVVAPSNVDIATNTGEKEEGNYYKANRSSVRR